MRNVVVHDYGKVDLDLVWKTVVNDILVLKAFCEKAGNFSAFFHRANRCAARLFMFLERQFSLFSAAVYAVYRLCRCLRGFYIFGLFVDVSQYRRAKAYRRYPPVNPSILLDTLAHPLYPLVSIWLLAAEDKFVLIAARQVLIAI